MGIGLLFQNSSDDLEKIFVQKADTNGGVIRKIDAKYTGKELLLRIREIQRHFPYLY